MKSEPPYIRCLLIQNSGGIHDGMALQIPMPATWGRTLWHPVKVLTLNSLAEDGLTGTFRLDHVNSAGVAVYFEESHERRTNQT